MNTKYGTLPDEMLVAYVDRMMSQVFKMLPMKEQGIESLSSYIESTLREFVGEKELVDNFRENEHFLSILGIMESLLEQDNIKHFRSDIFKITNLIEKLKSSLGDANE